MKLHISKIVFLHALGSLYEAVTLQTHSLRKLRGKPSYPTEAECERLNAEALRSV